MKEIHFDVDLTVSDLYAFSMRHTYCSVSGVAGLLISCGSLVVCAVRHASLDQTTNIALIIIGLLFTVVQPLMLYSKAYTQRRRNKDINAPLHYVLHEDGISVSQGEQQAWVYWYDVRKMVQAHRAIYLYMSPVRAFIFPRNQCGKQFTELVELIRTMMERYKNYDPSEAAPKEMDDKTEKDALNPDDAAETARKGEKCHEK